MVAALTRGDLDLKKESGERHLVEKIHNKNVKRIIFKFSQRVKQRLLSKIKMTILIESLNIPLNNIFLLFRDQD